MGEIPQAAFADGGFDELNSSTPESLSHRLRDDYEAEQATPHDLDFMVG